MKSSILPQETFDRLRAMALSPRDNHSNRRRGINVHKMVKEYIYEYKLNHGCCRCPEKRPSCLQFHHKNPDEKKFSISEGGLRRNLEETKLEIEKCIVLCANCHAVEEWGDGYKAADRPKGTNEFGNNCESHT